MRTYSKEDNSEVLESLERDSRKALERNGSIRLVTYKVISIDGEGRYVEHLGTG